MCLVQNVKNDLNLTTYSPWFLLKIPYFPGYKSHWSISRTLLFETKLKNSKLV